MFVGTSVRWPPATYRNFCVMSSFKSNIRWQVISVCPTGNFSYLSHNLKKTREFFISSLIVSWQIVFPLSSSRQTTSFIVLGISIPNFILPLRHLATWSLSIIRSRLLMTFCTHQLNAGSLYYLNAIADSETSMVFDFLISERGIQLVDLSFQQTLPSKPFVVITGAWRHEEVSVKTWSRRTAIGLSLLKSSISSKRPVSHPSASAMLKKFSAMTLTEYSSIQPSGNQSSQHGPKPKKMIVSIMSWTRCPTRNQISLY